MLVELTAVNLKPDDPKIVNTFSQIFFCRFKAYFPTRPVCLCVRDVCFRSAISFSTSFPVVRTFQHSQLWRTVTPLYGSVSIRKETIIQLTYLIFPSPLYAVLLVGQTCELFSYKWEIRLNDVSKESVCVTLLPLSPPRLKRVCIIRFCIQLFKIKTNEITENTSYNSAWSINTFGTKNPPHEFSRDSRCGFRYQMCQTKKFL